MKVPKENSHQQNQLKLEVNIKNKFKSRNSIEIQSVTSEIKSSPPSTSQLNNDLTHRQFGRIKQLVDNFEQSGDVIRLAYLTTNQEVHIDEESLYFLQKYSTFEISFIAFTGQRQCGKSFLLDTLLNISCAQGNQFTTVTGQSREKGIYLWTIPFSSNFKRKIFLIQCSGISYDSTQLIREDQILLDLTNILASTLVVVNPNEQKKKRKNPIFEKDQQPTQAELYFIEEHKKSSKRILNEDKPTCKFDSYWPQVIYSLYNSKPPIGTLPIYEECYNNCNILQLPQAFLHENLTREEHIQALNNKLSGINPQFLSKINQFFLEIIDRTTSKQYLNLKYTGNICCKLLINSIKYLNKKSKIKINKIFASILKELYQSSYTYHTQLYDDYLQEYFNKQQPLSFDDLIEAFKISSTYAIDSFNEIIIEEVFHQEYENKLLTYIENKEKLIIEVNSKKTKNSLKEKIKQIENVKINDIESIKSFLLNLNSMQHKLDHNKTQIIAEKILKYTRNIQKRIIQQRQRQEKEIIAKLKKKRTELEQHFHQLKEENQIDHRQNRQNEKKYRQLTKQQSNTINTTKTLKKQIEAQKRYQKEYIVSKQSKKQYAQSLLDIVRQLQQKVRDNKKTMEQIYKEYEYHPDIMILQKKLEDKQREIKELERVESKIDFQSKNSIFSKNSALKSNASVVRSAIQKPKEQKTQSKPIKKLTKK